MEPSKNFKDICSNFRSEYVGKVEDVIVDTISSRENMSMYPSEFHQNNSYNSNSVHLRDEIQQKLADIVKDDNYLVGFEDKKETFKQFMTMFNKYIIKESLGQRPFEVFSDGLNLDESMYYHMYLAVFCMDYFYSNDTDIPDSKTQNYLCNLIRRIYRWPSSANLLSVLCTKIQKSHVREYSNKQLLVQLREIVLDPPKDSYT